MTAMSTAITRQIVLDTETTGMNQIGAHYEGHKIIEIGAVEVINRRLTGNNFHVYLKPDRLVDPEAFGVHGIADEFLLDKPTFADVADEFMDYIRGAELVIHNASFDIGFMDYEFSKLNRGIGKTETFCKNHRQFGAGAENVSRQAQQPRCAMFALRNRQQQAYAARGVAPMPRSLPMSI
ncbi:DNA polymerase III subunit epsilon [Klebsiella pneumoniae]|uniref:DNA polymerase III subunit epsilon n=1 Tax=Klebsiella pneumoniae TaxID=573 RepID=A0A377W6I7_KLEPN|nr:DNA polymerase III subunit epsilon [Klebsiella pneumoniae]